MRNRWTDDDLALLESAFREDGPVVLPPALLERHPRGSCNQQAYRRGFTLQGRSRRLGLEHSLSDADRAYLAGLIDGEGHVKFEPQPIFTISTTDTEIRDWLMDRIRDLRCYEMEKPAPLKLVYRLVLSHRHGIAEVGRLVAPHLVLSAKRAEFETFIEWQEDRSTSVPD